MVTDPRVSETTAAWQAKLALHTHRMILKLAGIGGKPEPEQVGWRHRDDGGAC